MGRKWSASRNRVDRRRKAKNAPAVEAQRARPHSDPSSRMVDAESAGRSTAASCGKFANEVRAETLSNEPLDSHSSAASVSPGQRIGATSLRPVERPTNAASESHNTEPTERFQPKEPA